MVWARSEISLHTNQTIEAPRLYLRPHVRQVVTKQWCRLVPPAPNKTGWKRTKGPRGDDILRLWTASGQKAVLNRRFPSFFFFLFAPLSCPDRHLVTFDLPGLTGSVEPFSISSFFFPFLRDSLLPFRRLSFLFCAPPKQKRKERLLLLSRLCILRVVVVVVVEPVIILWATLCRPLRRLRESLSFFGA